MLGIELPDLQLYWTMVGTKLFWLVVLIVADLVFGVIAAFKNKEFSWDYLNNYLFSNGGKLLAWLFAEFLLLMPANNIPEQFQQAFTALAQTPYVTIFGAVLASLLGHFADMGVATNVFNKVAIGKQEKVSVEQLLDEIDVPMGMGE